MYYFRVFLWAILFSLVGSTRLTYAHTSYNFAGIIPIVTDQAGEKWLYLGVEYRIKVPMLAIIGGKTEKNETPALTAIRELNEETLDVFENYINTKTLENKSTKQLDYNLLFLIRTKIYWVPINFTLSSTNKTCEQFILDYKSHRFDKPDHYQSLKRYQRETYELRRVKLKDLIKFLKNPYDYKYSNKLLSYGLEDCSTPISMPLRWSTKILLNSQPDLLKFLK